MDLEKQRRGVPHARSFATAPVSHAKHHSEPARPQAPIGPDWVGWRVTDEFGRTVGRVEGTIGDEWLIIRDRRLHHALAPAWDAIAGAEAVFLPYPYELIEAAPRLGPGQTEVSGAVLESAQRHYRG